MEQLSRIRDVAAALIVLAAILSAAACDRSADDEVASEAQAAAQPQESGVDDPDTSTGQQAEPGEPSYAEVPPIDEDEIEARRRVVAEVDGERGPVTCETVCDCPAGWGCQPVSQRCVPGRISGRCCSWESECPEGATCVDAEGQTGVCGAP